MAVLVALLVLHLRSVRVFRWEQSVSGGVLVTYFIVAAGLALCAGSAERRIKGLLVQCFLCCTGAFLLILNAITLWTRWRAAGDLTQAVADLLSALGVPIRKQMLAKILLSTAAACIFIADLILVILYKEHVQFGG
ncbi:uncharacterized protein LOC125241832 [Leguminivora glycinivorella]|uniref:uncharacterized protein LOC125241832 n=1 Tax=Leguminivora glycinivorella TaxID=1035111 RepID=UPI00200DE402|nr:uncharacterized protein LOC125241832 [Leguminivora glycinivorella]